MSLDLTIRMKALTLALIGGLVLSLLSSHCKAQDIEPRRWSHLPIGGNFFGSAYAYTKGEIFLDPVLRIEDGEFDLHTTALKYIRSFEAFGKSARFDVTQPYQSGTWSGLLDGLPASVSRDGWADTNLRLAVNLYGAPPLRGKEFADYRAQTKSETIVGAGLVVQLPTGEYFEDKLINLGNNRYTFRPQLGVVHTHNRWTAELTTAAWFFTDNDRFFNGRHLEQDPILTADGHLIYTFRPGLWLSTSLGYGWGGQSVVSGNPGDNRQNSLAWGLALGIPINPAWGIKVAYIGTHSFASTGVNSDTVAVALSVMW